MNTPNGQEATPCPTSDLEPLQSQLLILREKVLAAEVLHAQLVDSTAPVHRKSVRNLIQYLAFRTEDVRDLQLRLSRLGLSSFSRAERKVQATLDMILFVLHKLQGKAWDASPKPPFCFEEGRQLLENNAAQLLGQVPEGRRARIMVTMPSTAAADSEVLEALLRGGMNVARINCAHDTPEVWLQIINQLNEAKKITGKSCLVHMDLGGPKLRTAGIQTLVPVLKVKPSRNETGVVTAPAVLRLYSNELETSSEINSIPALPVSAEWLHALQLGDSIRFKDARNSKRRMQVVSLTSDECIVHLEKTAYFIPGLVFVLDKKETRFVLGLFEGAAASMPVTAGDILHLKKDRSVVGVDSQKSLMVGCTIPEVLARVKPGESIWFDDGKIGGIVEENRTDEVSIRINFPPTGVVKLRNEKGINLPDTEYELRAMTAEDKEALRFAMKYADTIGLSFANTAEDVQDLIQEMKLIGGALPGIILKIETAKGFTNLPNMLIAAMQLEKVPGVMIARGDLAIECGFGRLAELQEEILWICEAAHVPVIWATQVLESLAKTGVRTRSEVTDAAMGQRAECIMLNKGAHIVTATRALADILHRMQDHQTKKRANHRKLHVAEAFFASGKSN
jgi:pyruvate kinase